MKWEDLNWKIIFLGMTIMMLIMYFTGCNHREVVNHSCPEEGHGPCYLCNES
jgi:hypothetical protein